MLLSYLNNLTRSWQSWREGPLLIIAMHNKWSTSGWNQFLLFERVYSIFELESPLFEAKIELKNLIRSPFIWSKITCIWSAKCRTKINSIWTKITKISNAFWFNLIWTKITSIWYYSQKFKSHVTDVGWNVTDGRPYPDKRLFYRGQRRNWAEYGIIITYWCSTL